MTNVWMDKPACMWEAAEKKKGLHWALEILVFFAVFMVAQTAMSVVTTPVLLVSIFSDPAFWDACMSGDIAAAMEPVMDLASSELFTIVSLVAQALMILVDCLFCKVLQKRKMRTLGFCKKGKVREYLIGVAVGFGMFSLAVLGSVLTGGLRFEGLAPNFSILLFLCYLVGFMIQGMAEEVLCRGYFMVSFARKYPVWLAVLVNSLLFAALHLLNPGITVLAFVNLTLFGIFASLYFLRRGSIWGIGAIHSVWNLVQGNFYGIKVSGAIAGNSLLVSTPDVGKPLLSGGDFGLEGSVFVTIVLLLGIGALWFWKGKRQPQDNVETELTEV